MMQWLDNQPHWVEGLLVVYILGAVVTGVLTFWTGLRWQARIGATLFWPLTWVMVLLYIAFGNIK